MSDCATCKKPIVGKVLSALDKKYHPEHFVCLKCKLPITDDKFQQHEGEPVCEADYARFFLKKCFACKLPIKGKVIKALDHDWHEDHFVCSSCKNPLAGQTFREREKQPVCLKCFEEKFADKCKGCTKAIMDKAVIALNAKWHQDCFTCHQAAGRQKTAA